MIQIGLLLYCFLLYIRPADWMPEVLNWPLEFAVLAFTAIVAGWKAFQDIGTDEARPISHHLKFLALWLLAILVSNVSHLQLDAAGTITVDYIKKCAIAATLWMALTSLRQIRAIALSMAVLAAALGLQGIYQKEHGFGWAGQHLYWDDRICWVGLWDGANVLSLVFVTAVPFCLEILLGRWNWILKMISAGCIGLILTGLVLAASRGGWLALAVIIFVYFQRRIGKLGLVLGVIALAGLMVVAPSRLSRDDERDSSSTQGRIDMWAEGIEMFKANPAVGVGKGQFFNYTHSLIAHNAFVQNMGETGAFGLFAWVGLIYISYKSLRVVRQASEQIEDKRILGMNEALFTVLTGYLAASMFITTDFDLLYLVFGLCGAMVTIARNETGLPLELDLGFKDHRAIMMCVVGGVFGIYTVTMAMSR